MAISSITSTATHKEKTGQKSHVSRKGGVVGVFKFTFIIWHTLFSFEFFHRFPALSHSFSHIRGNSLVLFFTCGSSLPRLAEACWGPEIQENIKFNFRHLVGMCMSFLCLPGDRSNFGCLAPGVPLPGSPHSRRTYRHTNNSIVEFIFQYHFLKPIHLLFLPLLLRSSAVLTARLKAEKRPTEKQLKIHSSDNRSPT